MRVVRAEGPRDLERIRALRARLFEPGEAVSDSIDEYSTHFFVEDDGELLAALRVTLLRDGPIDEAEHLQITEWLQEVTEDEVASTGMYVAASEARGGRASRLVLAAACTHVRESGCRLDVIDCEERHLPLFERIGYRRFRGDYCADRRGRRQYPMVTFVQDVAYYAAVGSAQHQTTSTYRADVRARRAFARRFETDWVLPQHQVLRNVLGEPFRHYLNQEQLRGETELFGHEVHEKGQRITAEGERGDRCWIVASGNVRITQWAGTHEKVVRDLGEGDFFGEIGVFGDIARTATVTALDRVETLVLTREVLRNQMGRHSPLAMSMLRVLARWFVENEGYENEADRTPQDPPDLDQPPELSEAELAALLQRLERSSAQAFDEELSALLVGAFGGNAERYERGQWVVEEGQGGTCAWLVVDGVVEVVRPDRVSLAMLRPGDCFGEIGLLTGLPRTAHVRAYTGATLLRMPRKPLLGLLQAEPELTIRIIERVAQLISYRTRLRRDASGEFTPISGAVAES